MRRTVTLLAAVCLFCFAANAYSQTYIPEAASSPASAEVVLYYSSTPGGNKPIARFVFKDGFEIQLVASCPGEFAWCMRVTEGEGVRELGSLRMTFLDNNRTVAVTTKGTPPDAYKKYLDMLSGKYRSVP